MPTRQKQLTILHSSDWHLGRSLHGRKRYREQEAFLDWLAAALDEFQVDVLLVAGDIYDSGTPSNRAQELYYRFMHRAAASACRHVVIIAGNHDSASFLATSKDLLRVLDIHVVAGSGEDRRDEVLVLKDGLGNPELVVCAVPYLRERDLRLSISGESLSDKEANSREGIRRHYEEVVSIAEEQRKELGYNDLPLVLMGHLFVTGGQTIEGDGVRDLYVGTLAHTSSVVFPSSSTYVALGHLHVPQKIAGSCEIRYSGSPIPMGFGEAKQQKSVCLVSLTGANAQTNLVPVPVFQQLERIRGDSAAIVSRAEQLLERGESVWLEIVHDGHELLGDLRDRLEELTAESSLEVLRISSSRSQGQTLSGDREETLADLDPVEVFDLCLRKNEVPEEQRPDMERCYAEILHQLLQEGKV